MEDVCNSAIIVWVWGPSLITQTYLAAAITHCCISANRYGGLWASGVSLKSLHAFVIRGKCVFLMSLYDCQEVRKCSSVSSGLCVQWENSLSSPGSRSVCGVPSPWPGCVRWVCIWSRISSVLGRYSGQVFCYGVASVEGQKARQFTQFFGGLFPMCQIVFL